MVLMSAYHVYLFKTLVCVDSFRSWYHQYWFSEYSHLEIATTFVAPSNFLSRMGV